MHIGILVSGTGASNIRHCLNLAGQAERLGFASVWVLDAGNPLPALPGHKPGDGSGEPLTLLCALAQVTSRVEIGVVNLTVPLHHPLVIAKMLSTADRLSGGRVIFGASIGEYARDFAAAGVVGRWEQRESVTDDYLRAIKEAWLNTGPSRYTGEHVRFAEVGTFPHPVRQPHIPIWIAGPQHGWLRRAVRLGSGFISFLPDLDVFSQHYTVVRQLAERDRRDPDEITAALTIPVRVPARSPGWVEQTTSILRTVADAGVQHLIADVASNDVDSFEVRMEALQTFAAVLPALQTAGTGGPR